MGTGACSTAWSTRPSRTLMAEEETHPVDLSSLSSKLLPGFTTLGFKDERRNKVTFLSSATTALLMQNNSVFGDLKSDEMELLYSAYGDETGVQCALSLQEFVKDAGSYSKKVVDDLLDQITGRDHSRTLFQLKQEMWKRSQEFSRPHPSVHIVLMESVMSLPPPMKISPESVCL
nr:bromodomain-containing protein 9-like isoform X7 [Gorilla gorilla gorilla]